MAEVSEPQANSKQEPAASNQTNSSHGSKLGTVWVTLTIFVVLLILLIIFILQNSMTVHIKYFGANGKLQFGVAMLISAVVGALLTLLVGSARIVQLKLRSKAASHQSSDTV